MRAEEGPGRRYKEVDGVIIIKKGNTIRRILWQ